MSDKDELCFNFFNKSRNLSSPPHITRQTALPLCITSIKPRESQQFFCYFQKSSRHFLYQDI